MYAAESGAADVFRILLDRGATHSLQTAISMLLENGADPLVKDQQGKTACMYAKDYNVKSALTSWSKKQESIQK